MRKNAVALQVNSLAIGQLANQIRSYAPLLKYFQQGAVQLFLKKISNVRDERYHNRCAVNCWRGSKGITCHHNTDKDEQRGDPGGWDQVGPEKLIYPIDTHMHRIGTMLGATMRKTADMKTALEITGFFRRFDAGDPVKYDFALTRLGIRDDMEIDELQVIMQEKVH